MDLLSLIPVVGKVLDRVLPDKGAAAEAKLKLAELHQTGELAHLAAETELAKGQLEINKAEATNPSIFVSGWRPFIGWVCGTGLAFQFVIAPILTWAAALGGKPIAFPPLDMGTLLTLLGAMLGLGGMRTKEKLAGVAAK